MTESKRLIPTTQERTVFACDNCGVESIAPDDYHNHWPPDGWIHLWRYRSGEAMHFCGEDCLRSRVGMTNGPLFAPQSSDLTAMHDAAVAAVDEAVKHSAGIR